METITVLCDICRTPTGDAERHCPEHRGLSGETYKVCNQLKKAIKLRDVVLMAGGGAADTTSQLSRNLAEQIAGTGPSSEQTWALTAVLLG